MRKKTNLFSGLYIKHLGYYPNSTMKSEPIFKDVATLLEYKFKFIDFDGPKDCVHIFQTNQDFLIAIQNGKVRVTNVGLNMKQLRFCEDREWKSFSQYYDQRPLYTYLYKTDNGTN